MRSRTTARRLVTIGTRAALTAVLALAVFAFGRPAAGHAATGPLTVVAVGDSYAAVGSAFRSA